jgi:hypothetical protein
VPGGNSPGEYDECQYDGPRIQERGCCVERHANGQDEDGGPHDAGRHDFDNPPRAAQTHAHPPHRPAAAETLGSGTEGGGVAAESLNPKTWPHSQTPAISPAMAHPLMRFALFDVGLRR